ncbi:MAG: hypothetical protein RPR91_03420, partial [Colwellia sp.]
FLLRLMRIPFYSPYFNSMVVLNEKVLAKDISKLAVKVSISNRLKHIISKTSLPNIDASLLLIVILLFAVDLVLRGRSGQA